MERSFPFRRWFTGRGLCKVCPAVVLLTVLGLELGPSGGKAQTPGDHSSGALRRAVQKGDSAAVLTCLQSAPKERRQVDTTNTLLWAAYYGKPDLLEKLLAEGAPVNSADTRGWTALHAAVKGHQAATINLLMKHGANPNLRPTNEGPSAAMLASELNRLDLLRLMAQTPPVPPPAVTSVVPPSAPAAPDQLSPVAPTPPHDPALDGPFIAAARSGDVAAVKKLLAQGANPEAVNPLGWPASVLAASKGYTEVIRCLYERDHYTVHQEAPDHWTALMEAAGHGHLETVRLLLDCHAEPLLSNKTGRTARECAENRGFTEVAALLREAEEVATSKLPPALRSHS